MSGRDELLLWLNDRLGREIEVEIRVERGDLSVTLLQAMGELRHWSEAQVPAVFGALMLGPREDLLGWYTIGEGAGLDVTNIGDVRVDELASGELAVELREPEGVRLLLREHRA
jgi:hypothetical protein